MNPVQHAIKQVMFEIPRQVLETVFVDRNRNWRAQPASLEHQISSLCIRPRLMVDCNLIGGAEVWVSLLGLQAQVFNDHQYVYEIPKDRTQGRSILSALNITYSDPSSVGNMYGNPTSSCQSSAMLGVAQQLVDAAGVIPITGTSNVQLIGENVVLVRDVTTVPPMSYLRCIVANDENLSHLQVRSYPDFAEAAVLCVKAYVYNNYIIPMDEGQLKGGQQVGRFREVVDSYSDANELYKTYLREVLGKVLFMNDNMSFTRFTTLLVGGLR